MKIKRHHLSSCVFFTILLASVTILSFQNIISDAQASEGIDSIVMDGEKYQIPFKIVGGTVDVITSTSDNAIAINISSKDDGILTVDLSQIFSDKMCMVLVDDEEWDDVDTRNDGNIAVHFFAGAEEIMIYGPIEDFFPPPPLPDKEPPKITIPDDIFQMIGYDLSGTEIDYPIPSARDSQDPNPRVMCTPQPGSFFEIGNTVVECIAVDKSGNKSIPVQFTITVYPEPSTTLPRPETGKEQQPPEIPMEYIVISLIIIGGGGYLGYRYLGKSKLRNNKNQNEDDGGQPNVNVETRFGFE